MRLSATEIRLQLDDRVSAGSTKAFGGTDEEIAETIGQIRSGKELARVPVFRRGTSVMHLCQIGGEFGLLEFARRDILVRLDDLTPRQEAADGFYGDVQPFGLSPLLVFERVP